MALDGRKTLPAAFRSPPRNPAEAKAREAKDALAPRYDPADLDLPPAFMDERVAVVWAELAPVFKGKGVITEADVTCFTTICQMIADMRQYQKIIDSDGLVVEGAKGGLVKHPLISPLNQLRTMLRGYLCEIGWTPGSRTKVATQGSDKPKGKDALDDLLGVN